MIILKPIMKNNQPFFLKKKKKLNVRKNVFSRDRLLIKNYSNNTEIALLVLYVNGTYLIMRIKCSYQLIC